MFRRVLIANRGAIARRVVAACTALGIETVAVFSDADADAPHLAEASASFRLPGERAADTYLNQRALLAALESSGADAVHPGYGFLAENAAFARAVAASDATFIGPDPRWLETMGDKVAARALAAEHAFPVLAGSHRLSDPDSLLASAEAIGYPLMLKPTAGGGGIGMVVVRTPGELRAAVSRSSTLAQRSFGDGGLFVERWIESSRHVEFQVLGDGRGKAVHFHERECSVQRRNQKVIEESPAPGIDRSELETMAERSRAFVAEIGYDSVGTLETLRAGAGDYGFLEMNTRIQVEHGVTEMITGVDLVVSQIRLAAGEKLPPPAAIDGHAVEARIYAEHPRTLLPSTGKLTVFEPPHGLHGVRVDTGYQTGQRVTPYYDPLLAKVISHGRTREQAIGRLLVALTAFRIDGVHTNAALLKAVLGDDDFLAGRLDTGYLSRFLENLPESADV